MRIVDAAPADIVYTQPLQRTGQWGRAAARSCPDPGFGLDSVVLVGPHGTTIEPMEGSREVPHWVVHLIDRIASRESRPHKWIRLRWRRCSRGCAHGRTYTGGRISFYYARKMLDNQMLVMHEMAHVINRRSDKHGDGFYDALHRIARDEGMLVIAGTRFAAKAPMVRAAKRQEGKAA